MPAGDFSSRGQQPWPQVSRQRPLPFAAARAAPSPVLVTYPSGKLAEAQAVRKCNASPKPGDVA